jgi:hypothetical protein
MAKTTAPKTTKTAAPDMFAAAAINAVVPEKPKTKKAEKPGVEMGEALQKVAAIDAIMTSLKGIREQYEGQVKDEMADRFVSEGVAIHHRPENFRGVNGLAEASCELRKRSTASAIAEEEVSEFVKAGIEVEEIEVTPEAFLFNPEILSNPKHKAKLSAAIAALDFDGVQPILYQPAVKKYVATESMIDAVFSKAKGKVAAKLMSMVTVLGLKTKWNGSKKAAYTILADDMN